MAIHKGLGRERQIAVAKEAVRGTAEAAGTFWIPNSDMEINEKIKTVVDDASRGIIEDSAGESLVDQWAEGKISAPISDKAFGLILYAALGGLVTTANVDAGGTVKDHTFSVAQSSQHQSLTLFLDDPLAAQDYKYALGCLESLEIKYEKDKFLSYSATFKSKKGATATLTPAQNAENRFLPQHLTFKLASAISGLAAASAIAIKSLTLKINKNLEADNVLGTLGPIDFLNKQFEITGDVELLWSVETYRTTSLAVTAQAMRIDLKNTDVTIGTAANPELKIDLAKVYFEEVVVSGGNSEFVKQTLKFKAVYSITDTSMISAVLTSLQASY